jgi:hypothetical protein
VVVGIILTGLGGFGAYYYGKLVDTDRERASADRETELRSGMGKLLEGNDALQKRLEPFEQLARELHPSLGRDEALKKLRDDLDAVKERAAALERQVAPRGLSEEQYRAIVQVLNGSPARAVEISSVMGDTEAFELARELKAALEAAGWNVDGVNQSVFSTAVRGIIISVGQQPPPDTANELFRALQSAGIVAAGNLDLNKKDQGVSLWVGSK